jgi:hypothetical protein
MQYFYFNFHNLPQQGILETLNNPVRPEALSKGIPCKNKSFDRASARTVESYSRVPW